MDMELGSKSVDSKKFESRARKYVKIFELGQKKTDIALNKHRIGHDILNRQTSLGHDELLILKRVLSFGEMTSIL